ncbi:MAG TPA: hypothetical protein VF727_01240 [Allosphingosinicella sp.]|jgi:hypothetical protein
MDCLLVIASLCFTDVQRVQVSDPSTVSRWATVDVGPGEVTILLSADSYRGEFDPRLMHNACADGFCVTYYKSCEAAAQFTCYYSTDSSPYPNWLRISAPDARGFARVEESVSLLGPLPNTSISLPRLSVRSSARTPPYCRRGGRGPQCPQ